MTGFVARAGQLSQPVMVRYIWNYALEFNDVISHRMSHYSRGQNCMSFCLALESFMQDALQGTREGDRVMLPDEFSVTLLDSAQQDQGSNGCGVAVIQNMYCEAFGRHERIDSRNLNGSCTYRTNIKLALVKSNVKFLESSDLC